MRACCETDLVHLKRFLPYGTRDGDYDLFAFCRSRQATLTGRARFTTNPRATTCRDCLVVAVAEAGTVRA